MIILQDSAIKPLFQGLLALLFKLLEGINQGNNMKALMRLTRRSISALKLFGFDPKLAMTTVISLPSFYKDLKDFNSQNNKELWPQGKLYPCLYDKIDNAGTAKGAYFHQDLYIAQKIFLQKPLKHVDVASRIDGFVAHVASYREIEVFDIRPLDVSIKNIIFKQADITSLNKELENYCDSLSSLHAIEHIGLGRYGDNIDPLGYEKAIESLFRILKPNGTLYFSLPIGEQRVEFNSQRVFSLKHLQNLLVDSGKFTISDFSFVDDDGDLHTEVNFKDGLADNFKLSSGCGIFELLSCK